MMTLAKTNWIALGVAFAMVCGPATMAATPADKAPKTNPLQPAITALVKEYQGAMKKKGEGLREKCDYFSKEKKPEGVTPEVVIATLEKPVGGASDPRVEAYVKWQLLSAVDAKIPDELVPRAIKLYQKAPQIGRHPGLDRPTLSRTLQRVGINNKDVEVEFNKEYSEAVGQYRMSIEPILEYRDELFARLPKNFDTLLAGLADVYDRVVHGAPTGEFWKVVSGDIRSWALTGGKPDQIRRLAEGSKQLYAEVKADRNKPYSRIMWVKEDKFEGLKWQSEQTIQYDKTIDELATWLEERANQPAGGGLQFKESGDDKMKKK
jgi:hypothetical protein